MRQTIPYSNFKTHTEQFIISRHTTTEEYQRNSFLRRKATEMYHNIVVACLLFCVCTASLVANSDVYACESFTDGLGTCGKVNGVDAPEVCVPCDGKCRFYSNCSEDYCNRLAVTSCEKRPMCSVCNGRCQQRERCPACDSFTANKTCLEAVDPRSGGPVSHPLQCTWLGRGEGRCVSFWDVTANVCDGIGNGAECMDAVYNKAFYPIWDNTYSGCSWFPGWDGQPQRCVQTCQVGTWGGDNYCAGCDGGGIGVSICKAKVTAEDCAPCAFFTDAPKCAAKYGGCANAAATSDSYRAYTIHNPDAFGADCVLCGADGSVCTDTKWACPARCDLLGTNATSCLPHNARPTAGTCTLCFDKCQEAPQCPVGCSGYTQHGSNACTVGNALGCSWCPQAQSCAKYCTCSDMPCYHSGGGPCSCDGTNQYGDQCYFCAANMPEGPACVPGNETKNCQRKP